MIALSHSFKRQKVKILNLSKIPFVNQQSNEKSSVLYTRHWTRLIVSSVSAAINQSFHTGFVSSVSYAHNTIYLESNSKKRKME